MKLIPKAKPVRIRIKSGGIDHSSFDSLKDNLDLHALSQITVDNLKKWISQQGTTPTSDALFHLLSSYEAMDMSRAVAFASVLYSGSFDNNISDLHSLLTFWSDNNYGRCIELYVNSADHEELDSMMKDSELMEHSLVKNTIEKAADRDKETTSNKESIPKNATTVQFLSPSAVSLLRRQAMRIAGVGPTKTYPIHSLINEIRTINGEDNSLRAAFMDDALVLLEKGYDKEKEDIQNVLGHGCIYPRHWWNFMTDVRHWNWTDFLAAVNFVSRQ